MIEVDQTETKILTGAQIRENKNVNPDWLVFLDDRKRYSITFIRVNGKTYVFDVVELTKG